MRLYNPTPELIRGAHNGNNYYLEPGHFIQVTQETGEWILQRFSFLGVVDISIDAKDKKKDIQIKIVQKAAEGLEAYIAQKHHVIEQYIVLDTEMKQENQFGTVLNHKNVKQQSKFVELGTSMLKDLESKYGLSLRKAESEAKTKELFSSIDSIITEFEMDAEAQDKARRRETEIEGMLKELVPTAVAQQMAGAG
jgi:hypothetical protein